MRLEELLRWGRIWRHLKVAMNARLRRSKTSLRRSWVADHEWTPHPCACIESTLEHPGRREWPLRILSAWRLREVLDLCSRVALHVYFVSVTIWEDIFMILRALARAVRAQSLCYRVICWPGELRGEWCEISVSLLPSYLMVGGYWGEQSKKFGRAVGLLWRELHELSRELGHSVAGILAGFAVPWRELSWEHSHSVVQLFAIKGAQREPYELQEF